MSNANTTQANDAETTHGSRIEFKQRGVSVAKAIGAADAEITRVEYTLSCDGPSPVSVELVESVPPDVEDGEIGFPRDHEEDWTVTEDRELAFRTTLAPGEETTALFGVRDADAATLVAYEGRPAVEVTPRAGEAADAIDPGADAEQNAGLDGGGDAESGDDPDAGSAAGTASDAGPSGGPVEPGDGPDVEAGEDESDVEAGEDESDVEAGEDESEDGFVRASPEPEASPAGRRPPGADATADGTADGVPAPPTDGSLLDALTAELEAADAGTRAAFRDALGVGGTNSVDVRLEHLQKRVDTLAAYSDAMEAFIDENGSGMEVVEEVQAALARVDDRVADLEDRIDALQSVDDRVDDLDERVEAVDGRYEDLDERVEAVDGRYEDLDERVEAVDGRYEDLDERVEADRSRLAEVGELLADADADPSSGA
jgi:prefoldin subunit 5